MQVHPLTQDRVASTARYGAAAAKYRVVGQANPQARELLENNDVVPKQAKSEGFAALLEAAANYYVAGRPPRRRRSDARAPPPPPGRSRRGPRRRRQQEASYPGFARPSARTRPGDYRTAVAGYAAILQANPRHSLAAYNVACIAAVTGQRDYAIGWLQNAVADGFNDADAIARDPDFDSLHGDQRFAAIVAAARRGDRPERVVDAESILVRFRSAVRADVARGGAKPLRTYLRQFGVRFADEITREYAAMTTDSSGISARRRTARRSACDRGAACVRRAVARTRAARRCAHGEVGDRARRHGRDRARARRNRCGATSR